MTDTAERQLRRLLALIPELADEEEHPVTAIAERLNISTRELLGDLDALAERYDVPGGFVEPVQVFVSAETVSAVSLRFRRPMRLTLRELCALELGLALLRSEQPAQEAVIERARTRLRQAISRVAAGGGLEQRRHADPGASGGVAWLAEIRSARLAGRKVRLTYRAADESESSVRVICPYAMVNSNAAWYVIAWCERSQGLRFFRADRIEGVALLEETYEVPAGFHADRVFHAESPPTMTVRYGARIARWVAEREGKTVEPGEPLTLEHPMADLQWAVRHVLQYGRDAEALAPEELRTEIVKRLRQARARIGP
ncbi:MAG: helix-turn-helix transcriptional regulator [Gemmatimonadota bacterium]